MALWSEVLGVSLEVNDLTPEQLSKLLGQMDKAKHDKLMAQLDALVVDAKQHKEALLLAQRILSLVILRLIPL